MLRHTLLIALTAAILVVCGCKTGPLPTAEEKARKLLSDYKDPEQQKVLEGILDEQKDTGKTVRALREEINRREAVQAEETVYSPLQRDYSVSRALLVEVRRAVNREQYDAAAAYLDRLLVVLQAMSVECPAGKIIQHLERASYALQTTGVGIEADMASSSLLAALDVALKTKDAPVVPNLAPDLKETKALVDSGDFDKARNRIDEYVRTVYTHRTLVALRRAMMGVQGAREAMDREAGAVVLAELDQLSELLNTFGRYLKAVPPIQAPTEEKAGEAPSEKSEAAAPAGGEGAAPSKPAPGKSGGAGAESGSSAEPTT